MFKSRLWSLSTMAAITALSTISLSNTSNALALRNFRQLSAHFSVATGVPQSNYNVISVSREVRGSLPADSDLNGFGGTYVRAASSLGAIYCQELVNKEARINASDRRVFAEIDFSRPPSSQPDSGVTEVVRRLARYFWVREANSAETDLLVGEASSLRAALPQTTIGSKRLYVGLCAIVSSSLSSLVIRD